VLGESEVAKALPFRFVRPSLKFQTTNNLNRMTVPHRLRQLTAGPH